MPLRFFARVFSVNETYDAIVVGSGLGGLTAARRLAAGGCRVLLAEQHSQFGGLATYFRRRGHIFDVALHGFPIGMKKSFRKYWGKEFADRIVQVPRIRFHNPQFQLETTFDSDDFTRILTEHFGLARDVVDQFYATLKAMNYYDDDREPTAALFERFFPGRTDVWRLLMEPITYANGSGLREPAITYGIVFGNFMSKGVYLFDGGTDLLLDMMVRTLRDSGVECRTNAKVERIVVEDGRVRGAVVNGQRIDAPVVVSNGSLMRTVHEWVGDKHFSSDFLEGFATVRPSCSSCQVYMGLKPGEEIEPIGDLIFHSTCPEYDADALASPKPTSRTFSVYYPTLRNNGRTCIVASMNAYLSDWQTLDRQAYRQAKDALIENAVSALETFVPDIRSKLDHTEAATPHTFQRYTLHVGGASFGTKFEGLKYSMDIPQQVGGLFHTGSVGIIMSGWLGAANYGVIAANEADKYLAGQAANQPPTA